MDRHLLTDSQIPLGRAAILGVPAESFWHYLTVAFVWGGVSLSPVEDWARFASQARLSFVPSLWDPPAEVLGLVHVAQGDYVQVLMKAEHIAVDWLARQLAACYRLDCASPPHWEVIRRAARWIGFEGAAQGMRLHSIDTRSAGGVLELSIVGRAGVGSESLITEGDADGDLFRVSWTEPDAPQ